MPELRYLRMVFANSIRDYELPYFRAAVIEATSRQHDRFHNHTEDSRSIFRYPLVQYKTIGGKAALVCLGEAVDDIHYLLEQPALRFRIGTRDDEFLLEKVKLENYRVQLWEHKFNYSLHHWLPLHDNNFKQFMSITDEDAQLAELSRILTGNLLSFCKGINYWLDQQIVAKITSIHKQSTVKFKNYPYKSFSVNFSSNLSIPPYVGLGKGASLGFGVVNRLRHDRPSIAEAIDEATDEN